MTECRTTRRLAVRRRASSARSSRSARQLVEAALRESRVVPLERVSGEIERPGHRLQRGGRRPADERDRLRREQELAPDECDAGPDEGVEEPIEAGVAAGGRDQ